jgi:hypothetical protein
MLAVTFLGGSNLLLKTKVSARPSWGLSAGTNRAIISQELKMRVAATFQSDLQAAPKCTLRLRMSYPRVGVNLLPSNARPCLFGCD